MIRLLFMLTLVLASCDAVNHVNYTLKNESDEDLTLRFAKKDLSWIDSTAYSRSYGDTAEMVLPKDTIVVVHSERDIDFPWRSRSIYKRKPGVCGIWLRTKAGQRQLGCSKKEWTYRKRRSVLVLGNP